MEFFERPKSIVLNPKVEWEVIEAEGASHAKVLTANLIPMALIPAIAIIVNYYLAYRSIYNDIIVKATANEKVVPEGIACFKESFLFSSWVKWGIIDGLTATLIIIGSIYIAAFLINTLAEKLGSQKNFDRAFSLVAYSFTPLCLAGIFYIFSSLEWLVPYTGLYGLYMLYLGVKPMLKPIEEKLNFFCIIALISTFSSWYVINNYVIPEVRINVIASVIEQKAEDSVSEASNRNNCDVFREYIDKLDIGQKYLQSKRKRKDFRNEIMLKMEYVKK